jgi:hypothetical protein
MTRCHQKEGRSILSLSGAWRTQSDDEAALFDSPLSHEKNKSDPSSSFDLENGEQGHQEACFFFNCCDW